MSLCSNIAGKNDRVEKRDFTTSQQCATPSKTSMAASFELGVYKMAGATLY